MSLFDQISSDIIAAMKARQPLRLETLRSIKKEMLEARKAKNAGGTISPEDEIKLLQKLAKQRYDSAELFAAQNRMDLSEKEQGEAQIITEYLPEMMGIEELEIKIKAIITQEGATSMKDMGRVMGIATSTLAGKADGKEIAAIVKRLLSA